MGIGFGLGAVLTGGASQRMGRDKALIEVGGVAMAVRVAGALSVGGAAEVRCVGGDLPALAALGLATIEDEHPGAGPLGGLLTALHTARALKAEVAVVAACDHPQLEGTAVRMLVDALGAHHAFTVAIDPVGEHALLMALDVDLAEPVVAACFEDGLRSLRELFDRLPGIGVTGLAPGALHDVDRPSDLPF